jgi:hypothetical protein
VSISRDSYGYGGNFSFVSRALLDRGFVRCFEEPVPYPLSVLVNIGGGIWCSRLLRGSCIIDMEPNWNDFKHILRHHEELFVSNSDLLQRSWLSLGIWSRKLLMWKKNVNT